MAANYEFMLKELIIIILNVSFSARDDQREDGGRDQESVDLRCLLRLLRVRITRSTSDGRDHVAPRGERDAAIADEL